MKRQPSRNAGAPVRLRGVVVVVALSALALHVVAGAESHHVHETEYEACSFCAAFASEDDVVQSHQALPQASKGVDAAAPALRAPPFFRSLSYTPRGPPTLRR